MNKYIAGNIIDDIATFTKEDNVTLVDPTAIELDYRIVYGGTIYGPYTILYSGSSTPGNGVIAKLSTGKYEVQMDTTLLPGYWTWQWYGSGTGQALLPLSATVAPSPILTPF